ncbi:hypothetical protein TIFTF001_030920 [Ficus carica]|uniref:Uncharacterized protein n=1 Tax=Ficus carica TaxID=3494 RepID=A0AA88J4T4_FICCA|nr:hypothetical protein TIFTF001_030920 [Ficus carica]
MPENPNIQNAITSLSDLRLRPGEQKPQDPGPQQPHAAGVPASPPSSAAWKFDPPIRQRRGAPPPSFNSLWLGLQNRSTNFVIPSPRPTLFDGNGPATREEREGKRERRERGGGARVCRGSGAGTGGGRERGEETERGPRVGGGGRGWGGGRPRVCRRRRGVIGNGGKIAGDGEDKANACHARLWPLDRPQLQPRWWVTLPSRHVKSYVSDLRRCAGSDARVSIVFCASVAELHC